jgi:ornithine cyclodeaminase/alanine dehydrogenase-like protein (mu-crystallin family)
MQGLSLADTLLITQAEVTQLLSMSGCIQVMEQAFRALSGGETLQPLRQVMWLPDKNGVLAMMPAYLGGTQAMGLKAISVFPGNQATPFDSHQGVVLLFETYNGRLLAILDATAITAIRTAAVSALATRLLARSDATELTVLGSGTQARVHLEAMLLVRPISRVRVWSRQFEHAARFAELESERCGLPVEAVPSAQAAVDSAEVICTTTSATEPVLQGEWLAAGCHLNAVGSSTPDARELDTPAVARSRLFVDRRESALNEAGELLFAMKGGAVSGDHIQGELGDLLVGSVQGRRSADEITLFKSLGLAIEDLAAAQFVYQKALDQKVGTQIAFGGER